MALGSNPYLDSTVDAALGDTVRAYNLSTSPSIRSSMARSGSFGNSGLEQMAGESERRLQQSLGRQANDLRYGDYWNDQNFNRQLFNDQMGFNQQSLQNAMGLFGLQNNMNQQALGLGGQIQDQPLEYYKGFTNIANSLGRGYGTESSSMTGKGSPLMGALGGWQLGGSLFPGLGGGGEAVPFGMTGAQAGMFW